MCDENECKLATEKERIEKERIAANLEFLKLEALRQYDGLEKRIDDLRARSLTLLGLVGTGLTIGLGAATEPRTWLVWASMVALAGAVISALAVQVGAGKWTAGLDPTEAR